MFDWIFVALAALASTGSPAALDPLHLLQGREPVAFRPHDRQVTNWRTEAVANLRLPLTLAVQLGLGRDAPQVTRCVRMNNYWCIKRAGWAGEIAADAEDHVAFASAIEGADVAALLLRRYYMDYGRHSALAIISHWAPAQCGGGARMSAAPHRPALARADHLAARGLGHTLRARFLAAHGRRVARLRRSTVPDRPIAQLRAPAIAIGMGERPVALPAALPLSTATLAALGSGPSTVFACADDSQRIRNYADRAAAGVAPTAKDDLKLFASDGTPTDNLARVMRNMSAVEIGPLGAGDALVRSAVMHLAARRAAEIAKAAPSPAAASAPTTTR